MHYETTVSTGRHRGPHGPRRGRGRGRLRHADLRDRVRLRRPGRARAATSEGLYYVKNIRRAMEWDKVLDTVKTAVVHRGLAARRRDDTALAHRGHRDPPRRPAPVAAGGHGRPGHHGAGRGVLARARRARCTSTPRSRRSSARAACARWPPRTARSRATWSSSHPQGAQHALAAAAGLQIGSTGGVVVDERMATSVPGVFAARRLHRDPARRDPVPLQGLTGSHAYAQGKIAGINAGGGTRAYKRGVRALGHAGRQVDHRWRLVRRDHGDRARHPVRPRAGRRASPAPATTRASSR